MSLGVTNVDDLARQIDRLKAQLWKYGKHLTACRLQNRTATWCDCGWKEVRATLAPTQSDGEAP